MMTKVLRITPSMPFVMLAGDLCGEDPEMPLIASVPGNLNAGLDVLDVLVITYQKDDGTRTAC
jgi:hypothetical protein